MGDVLVAGVDRAAAVVVFEAVFAIPLRVIEVRIGAVRGHLVVRADCVAVVYPISVLVIDVAFIGLPVAGVVRAGELVGVIIRVAGVAGAAHQGGEVEVGDPAGRVPREVVIREDREELVRRAGLAACDARQPAGEVELVVAFRYQAATAQVGVGPEDRLPAVAAAGDVIKPAGQVDTGWSSHGDRIARGRQRVKRPVPPMPPPPVSS